MTDKKLPQIQQNTTVSSVLERSKSLMTVTQKVLQKAKAAKELAQVEDDSWMDRLIAWADLNNVRDYEWVEYHDGGCLKGMPRDKNHLRNLTQLDLVDKQLTSLPPEIGQLRNLTDLNLIGNKLTSLPPEIGQLRNLTELRLGWNQLTSLPLEIGNLQNLKKLFLNKNDISTLPEEISKCKDLEQLFVTQTILARSKEELARLKILLPNCKIYH